MDAYQTALRRRYVPSRHLQGDLEPFHLTGPQRYAACGPPRNLLPSLWVSHQCLPGTGAVKAKNRNTPFCLAGRATSIIDMLMSVT